MAKTTTPAAPETVVYIGPNIPGVVRQDSVFTGGIPAHLAEKIKVIPAIEGLIVPLDSFSEARKERQSGAGRIATICNNVAKKIQEGA